MSMLRKVWNLFSRTRLNREIEMELAAHIEMCIHDNIARGMTPDQAAAMPSCASAVAQQPGNG
jgi:hypothetical protein